MREVLTVIGCTPDPDFFGAAYPNAVREWCINTAVVDPFTPLLRPNLQLDVRPFLPTVPFEWGAVTQAGRHLPEPAAQFLATLKETVECSESPRATLRSMNG